MATKLDGAWQKLFDKYNIQDEIDKKGYYIITANQIREFREPRLMTKFDHNEDLPIIFKEANCLVVGCGNTVIPSSVTYIGRSAFSGCTGLHEIVIPESVTEIGERAFEGCDNLKVISVPKNKVDYYKERFPADMHWLIVEEGTDLPLKP